MRSTKIVNVDTLMLADASCIESDTSWISDNDWIEMLPTGSSLSQIESQFESGESVVLSDSPQSPLFTLSQGEWIKSVSASSAFPSCAVTAIAQRFSIAGSSTTFERAPYESLQPSPPLDYTPDTSKVKEQVIPISCQYNVEVACTPPCLDTLNYGYFMLAKTKNESSLALSMVKPLGKHSLFTALGKFEEPKQLLHMLATGKGSQLSVKSVKMVPLGSQQVYESFVPVQLTVQVGERLGYPTQGYFYHFKQGQLVHEYAIVEGGKGYFNITHSTANGLSDEINIPALRGFIFLPWKINGQLAAPQHIYYSKQKLTTEEFQGIDAAWLNTNAFTVDLQAILAANEQALLARTEEQKGQPPQAPQAVSRADNIHYQSSTPQLALGVIGITKQSVLNDVAVLNLGEIEDTAFNLGWFQCEAETPQSTLFDDLLKDASNPELKAFLLKYNQHLNEPVRMGEIILLPTTEPLTEQDKQAIKELQAEAEAASKGLVKLTPEENVTVIKNFEVFDHAVQSSLGNVSAGLGVASAAVTSNFKQITGVLSRINNLYISEVSLAGSMKNIDPLFYVKRAELFSELDTALNNLTMKSIQLDAFEQPRNALRLSTKSIIYNAADIAKDGKIPQLGSRIEAISKWSTGATRIGYIGVGLDVALAGSRIQEACTIENGECVKTSITETGRVAGGVWGGYAGASTTVIAAGSIALFFGTALSTPVIAVVAIVGAGVGALYGGDVGEVIGEGVNEIREVLLYEWTHK